MVLLERTRRLDADLVVATVVLVLADLVPGLLERVLAIVGVVVLATAVDPADGLPSGALAAVVVLFVAWAWPTVVSFTGPLVATFPGAGSFLGIYATAPDLEEVGAVAVAACGLAVLAAPRPEDGGPRGWALWGLLAWAAAQGSRGRPGAVVGSLACLAAAGLPAIVRRFHPTADPSTTTLAAVLGVQAIAVLVCSRVAGLSTSAVTAAAVAVPTLVAAVGLELVAVRRGSATPEPV